MHLFVLTAVLPVFQERAADLDELVSAEFGRLREFLLQEEELIKEKLQKQKEEKLNQLEEALTQATEQVSELESMADQLHLKLGEEENPEQLKVRGTRGEEDKNEQMLHQPFQSSIEKISYVSCMKRKTQARKYQRVMLYFKGAVLEVLSVCCLCVL